MADGCIFKVKNHNVIDGIDKFGLAVQMEFSTEEGSTNPFGIDVVFAVKTHSKLIKLTNTQVTAASLENIIIDKVAACYRFASGNTRMKDFDDLCKSLREVEVFVIHPNLIKSLQVGKCVCVKKYPTARAYLVAVNSTS